MAFRFSSVAAALGALVLMTAPGHATAVARAGAITPQAHATAASETDSSVIKISKKKYYYNNAPRRRNNTGRNVALGVGAVVLGTIIASEAARAQGSRGNSCGRLDYQCSRGSYSACRQFDRYC